MAKSKLQNETVQVIGRRWSRECHDAKDFLARVRHPYRWLDMERSSEAREILGRAGLDGKKLPVVVLGDGSVLEQPTEEELAERIGLSTEAAHAFYDLVIVGGGPAGLAAAVYGASEGLRTIIVERDVPGGQAGESTHIENYLGFPHGLSGSDLAQRAVEQACSFGAEVLVSREAVALRCEDPYRVVVLDDGEELYAYSVLLSLGISWRGLEAPGCETLTGAGVYYGGATAEAPNFEGQDVFLLGGGNSAGQAALHLARYARRVEMLVFEEELTDRMSDYLVHRIVRTPNIHVRLRTTVAEVHGNGRLQEITIQNVDTGESERCSTGGLFIFIGAVPRTDWLKGVLARDDNGFVLCGAKLASSGVEWPLKREPHLLETSIPGVFVAGDVRADSVKRIGSAVGEGSVAIQFVHEYLSER